MANYSRQVFLINDKLRGILCRYDPENPNRQKDTIFKTLDPSIKKDDLVVIPTGNRVGFTVVKVVDVDVVVDLDDPAPIEWIACKIDVENHLTRIKQEAEAIDVMQKAEFSKRRKTLLETTFGDAADQLRALPMATGGTAPVAE